MHSEKHASIPFIFSSLRESIEVKIEDTKKIFQEVEDCIHNPLPLRCIKILARAGSDPVGFVVEQKLIKKYLENWRDDIDSGLKKWPRVSHEVAISLFFNPDGPKVDEAKNILKDYLVNPGLSMAGAPDIVGEFEKISAQLIELVSQIVPAFIKEPIEKIKQKIYDGILIESIGMTADELKEKFANPATYFDSFMTTGEGELINRSSFNKKYLKLENEKLEDGSDAPFNHEKFTAAYNTVVMSKMVLMSSGGIKQLLKDIGADPKLINEFTQPNVMLGFVKSLDGDNQWIGDENKSHPKNSRPIIFARDCRIYTQIFMKQPKDIELSRILTEDEKAKEEISLKEIYTAVYNREPTNAETSNFFTSLAQCIPLDDTFPSPIIFVNNGSNKSIKVGSRDYPFKTLTDAINTAKDGDTLLISPGVYPEKITINKKIRLTGYVGKPVIIGN